MHYPSRSRRTVRLLFVAALLLFATAPAFVHAQSQTPSDQAAPSAPPQAVSAPEPTSAGGSVRGVVTTQSGTIPLGGVSVTLLNATGSVADLATEGDGTFRFTALSPGKYSVVVAAPAFDTVTADVTVMAGQTTEVKVDLKIASISEQVDVVAPTSIVPSTGTITSTEALQKRELEELAPVGGLQSALRLLISVIEVPGGLSIKGGRPNQATVQLGPGAFVDPATNISQVSLPDDAIDSVTVLPNPYAVEYGRFSSGLVLINTRRAGDVWKTRVNRLEPSFRTKRGEPLHVVGVSAFSPRVETGGPLIRNKLYLQQAAQYRYRTNEVPSRSQSELKTSNRFSSYTRLDANLTGNHSLVAAAGLFPASVKQATLGTFTPPDASVDMKGNVNTFSVTERSLWTDRLFTETTVEVHSYDTKVLPRGPAAMELLPETTLGNFFNQQRRATDTYQVIETLSGTSQGGWGLHLYKAGIDVLHSRYTASSASRPVLIRNSNGTLRRRLDFLPGPMSTALNSTDLALFAQDRMQPNNRYYIEFGARLDRDGVLERFNITPRVGAALLLNDAGTSVIRSGYGLFYERTPSAAGVFESYEDYYDTRYAPDGVTPIAPPLLFTHVEAPDLRTSRSWTWDLAFDHRFNPSWAAHVGVINRLGSHELLVEPVVTPDGAFLRLDSDGRSLYREAEIGVHYTGGHGVDLNLSYVRARARTDLNGFPFYFDHVLAPIVGENAYGPARTDVPHRFLARGRATPFKDWLLVGVLDWRSGLPYSVVDESLDFVGERNDRRFPNYFRVDLGIEHRIKIGKLRPWVGVRADNAFSSFLPSDVQANIGSPAFGSFYNSEYRQFRIQVRFEQ